MVNVYFFDRLTERGKLITMLALVNTLEKKREILSPVETTNLKHKRVFKINIQ